MTYSMVFDVESIGLHGEAFAVGYVVMDGDGNTVAEKMYACPPEYARGTREGHDWVRHNVHCIYNCNSPQQVRTLFWIDWKEWKEKGASLWADCAWPVEARFLAECVDDEHPITEWDGPYPLHDIATLALANDIDPLRTFDRMDNELPAHNPLNDARQSARILYGLLIRI